jgi:hypothetical protein
MIVPLLNRMDAYERTALALDEQLIHPGLARKPL